MEFFTNGVELLKVAVTLIGSALGGWGIINLLEGYGGDNPASKSQGVKQLVAGVGIALVGQQLIPQLATMFTI